MTSVVSKLLGFKKTVDQPTILNKCWSANVANAAKVINLKNTVTLTSTLSRRFWEKSQREFLVPVLWDGNLDRQAEDTQLHDQQRRWPDCVTASRKLAGPAPPEPEKSVVLLQHVSHRWTDVSLAAKFTAGGKTDRFFQLLGSCSFFWIG